MFVFFCFGFRFRFRFRIRIRIRIRFYNHYYLQRLRRNSVFDFAQALLNIFPTIGLDPVKLYTNLSSLCFYYSKIFVIYFHYLGHLSNINATVCV